VNIRKNVIRLITFLGGLYFVLEFVLPAWIVERVGVAQVHDQITYGFIAVGSMAFGLGIINLFMVHGARILYLRRDWIYSVVLLSGLVLMSVVSSMDWYYSSRVAAVIDRSSLLGDFAQDIAKQIKGEDHVGTRPVPERLEVLDRELNDLKVEAGRELELYQGAVEDRTELTMSLSDLDKAIARISSLKAGAPAATRAVAVAQCAESVKTLGVKWGQWLRAVLKEGTVSKFYTFLVDGLFNALGAAMFSLLSVYIAAAAFRAFRIRSWESSLMMLAAVVVILGQTPFGVWIWDALPAIRQWLMEVPNSGAFRAIKIGSGVAGLVMAFRMWLSIESESFS
jgi:hypothetical protein